MSETWEQLDRRLYITYMELLANIVATELYPEAVPIHLHDRKSEQ